MNVGPDMTSMPLLRERSSRLYAGLLEAQAAKPSRSGRRPRAVRQPTPLHSFSWFDPDDALEATALSFRLSALAASRSRVNDGLDKALDHVEDQSSEFHPELIRQGFAVFVTHNRNGRLLSKPRTVVAAPGLFNPPPAHGGIGLAVSLGGESPELDYWREDVLANEHHQHWHEVYPYTGLPPRDFRTWVGATSRTTLSAIIDQIAPGQGAAFVANSSPTELARVFSGIRGSQLRGLAPVHYGAMFRMNDRQGELFFYMHQQMLARYDAELISHGLSRVGAFGPAQWATRIAEGYDPEGFLLFGGDFRRREENQSLAADAVSSLRTFTSAIDEALRTGTLVTANGSNVDINRTNLGEAVEAAAWQLTGLDPNTYPGLHNSGHGRIARLSPGGNGGVMASTATAIRDQVFWRWHRAIDDINARWQSGQNPNDFSDAPKVLVRDGIGTRATAWSSPDIIVCRTTDLPEQTDLDALGGQLFGGDHWDQNFSSNVPEAGGVPTLDELTTTMLTTTFGNRQIKYLSHEPFTTFFRLENTSTADIRVTVRMFLVPSTQATDRRAWIELDKFVVDLAASARVVVARSDAESSVVKRQIDLSPNQVLAAGVDPDDDSYCDCGWPYTLLLPRGDAEGLRCRLMVMCTDASIDLVPVQGECGSMSFCGAVDRYPDARDMGYPFNRPFPGSRSTAIRDVILAAPHMAARTLTIRHTS